jgi:hypothetical protein
MVFYSEIVSHRCDMPHKMPAVRGNRSRIGVERCPLAAID